MRYDNDCIAGVLAHDKESGQDVEVHSRCVINATGAWADIVQRLAGEVQVKVQPAKGVHVVVPADSIDSRTGFIAPTADSVLVVRPWGQYWIIGTTDTPWNYDRDDPVANASDINYLLTETNKWLRTPLTVDDIVGFYAGVRPLLSARSGSTAALSREHVVLRGPAGLFTIVGGKYTTYRVMAKDVMDAVARWLGGSGPPSVTARTPLLGTEGWYVLHNQRQRLASETGLDIGYIDHLLRRYGSLVREIFDLLAEHPELACPIEGASTYLAVEAVYAASHEGALHLDDVLMRRTHIAMETKDHGLKAAEQVARLVGEVLDWDTMQREQEIAHYEARVKADQLAALELTDATAIAAHRPVLHIAETYPDH